MIEAVLIGSAAISLSILVSGKRIARAAAVRVPGPLPPYQKSSGVRTVVRKVIHVGGPRLRRSREPDAVDLGPIQHDYDPRPL